MGWNHQLENSPPKKRTLNTTSNLTQPSRLRQPEQAVLEMTSVVGNIKNFKTPNPSKMAVWRIHKTSLRNTGSFTLPLEGPRSLKEATGHSVQHESTPLKNVLSPYTLWESPLLELSLEASCSFQSFFFPKKLQTPGFENFTFLIASNP